MPSNLPAADDRCIAGILFALSIEADLFARRVADEREWRGTGPTMHEGTLAGRRVAWCVTGVGADAAMQAARLMLDGHHPLTLVSAGFAGGLHPTLPRGAVVRPGAVIDETGGARIALAAVGDGPAGPTLVSVAEPATTPDRKRELAARTAAAVVDMETHAVASAARSSL